MVWYQCPHVAPHQVSAVLQYLLGSWEDALQQRPAYLAVVHPDVLHTGVSIHVIFNQVCMLMPLRNRMQTVTDEAQTVVSRIRFEQSKAVQCSQIVLSRMAA